MALAFDRRPARSFAPAGRRPNIPVAKLQTWLAHCAIVGAFCFVAGTVVLL